MLDTREVLALPQLGEPVLTAYLDTDPADPRNQGRKGPGTWLRSEARRLVAAWGPSEREACLAQAERISEYLTERRGGGSRGLVVFAGPNTWRLLPLQVHVEEEIYWGEPALGQLLWLLDEHQPCGIVVVRRSGARFFRYRMGEIEEDAAWPIEIDTSQWKERNQTLVVGTAHDLYEQRVDANLQRFYAEIARECQRWSQQGRLHPIALLGNLRAIEQVRAALPEAFAPEVVSAAFLPTRATPSEIVAHAEPLIEQSKRERERADVQRLLEQRMRKDVVTGFAATLNALQEGRVRELIAVRDLRGRVRACPSCGWVEQGGPAACPQCGHARPVQSPRAVLPQMAQARGVPVEIVAGAAAEELERGAEGLAGWLKAA